MSVLYEQHFCCPYCDASVSVLLDMSVESQDYVEDCEVCCRPIRVSYRVDGDTVSAFSALALDDA